ncbi:MAG TPA: class I SAM-dependent methyltransferase [Candidatus Lokiarchaeia archaeon]|nr:class I SAM-dependent methyltransferase [Candidatus Lokiarchaeia archaeon]
MEGRIAKWYARSTKKDMDEYKRDATIVAGKLADGAVVLEIAPGPGYLAIELSKLGNFEVHGVDISETFVNIAQANAMEVGVSVDFRQGDASNLPFSDGFCDFVVNRAAFKNFTDPVRVLNEIYRVLKNGGLAVIFDLKPDIPRKIIDEYVRNMHLGRMDALWTKWGLQSLRRWAHSRAEFEEFISKTSFSRHDIQENSIGLAVWLYKT